jgi:ribonuclease P protein component
MELRFIASLSRYARIGIIVPRYGRSAVDRNRLKRRAREIVRLHVLPAIATRSVDVVLRFQPSAYGADFAALREDIVGGVAQLSHRLS